MKNQILAFALALPLIGCSAKINPFESSDEAMMAKIVQEFTLGGDVIEFLKKSKGEKIILVNMEDPNYTNDSLPEYMIHDAIYSRIASDFSGVELLERDSDIISIIEQENQGIEFCPSKVCDGSLTEEGEEVLTAEERRHRVGELIREITTELANQDVVVMNEDECCNGNGKTKSKLDTMIVANEVGKEKSELLQALVKEYMSLFKIDTKSRDKKPETQKLSIEMPKADYLFSYRVYDYGNWIQTKRKESRRITYIKLHVRIVDMSTGEVVVSDFIEHTIEDTMSTKERAALSRSKANQSDYGRPSKRKSRSTKSDKKEPSSSSSKKDGLFDRLKK